jgi:hypothetical protein
MSPFSRRAPFRVTLPSQLPPWGETSSTKREVYWRRCLHQRSILADVVLRLGVNDLQAKKGVLTHIPRSTSLRARLT